MSIKTEKIAFIGAGNMASAMIGGLIHAGVSAEHIVAADPFAESLQRLQQAFKVKTSSNNRDVIADANIVVLAVKPQQLKEVCAAISADLLQQKPLIISIAAGITSGILEQWLDPSLAIVRCMPNTPALIGRAASGLFANANVNEQQKDLASQLMLAVGAIDWVEQESLLDAVTALSGSGPAYFFLVMEAMIDAGVKLGLSREVAENLTLQTALGAAKMARTSEVDVAELRKRVTSPGGTTQAAIEQFEQGGIRQLFEQALVAADARSKSLAQELQ
jgi:pyrroline-5-carboxylate reductase